MKLSIGNSISIRVLDFSSLFLFIFSLFISDVNIANQFLFFLGIGQLIIIGGKLKNFQPGLLFLIFISTYLLYLIPLVFFDIPIAGHTQFSDIQLYNKTLMLFIFFLCVFNVFLKTPSRNTNKLILNDLLTRHPSSIVFYFLIFLQVLIIIYALFKGESILNNVNSYDSYKNNLENQNGLWEYFYILFILSFVFSFKNKLNILIMYLIYVLYFYVSITRGYRIQLIQMTILFFILFLDGKLKNYQLIILSFFGLVFMELYGIIKVIGNFDAESINEMLDSNQVSLVTNQTEVFYSTTSVLTLKAQGVLGIGVQIETFIGFIVNFIVPTGLMWHGSRILDNVGKFADIGGGGFCFGYFFFWLGYLGIVLLSYHLARVFNFRFSKSNFSLLFLIFTISLTPRWFAYEPTNHLIRLPLTMLIAYAFIYFLIIKPLSIEKSTYY